jgi:hypothetical protein
VYLGFEVFVNDICLLLPCFTLFYPFGMQMVIYVDTMISEIS